MSDLKERITNVKDAGQAVLRSDGTILIKEVRASYPHIGTAYKGKDPAAKARYGITGLMPKTKKYFPAKDLIRDEIKRIIKANNKDKDIAGKNKFIRDGDDSGRDEYQRMYEIHAGEARRPAARDSKRDPATNRPRVLNPEEADERIYAGCWVNLLIRPWWQDNEFGKKVNANLIAVQFVRDDESFGQSRVSADDIDSTFDEFADDDDSGYDDELGETDEL